MVHLANKDKNKEQILIHILHSTDTIFSLVNKTKLFLFKVI